MSETQEKTEVLTRQITVKPTRGESKVIEYTGNSWAELKDLLIENGYSLSNMKCVESIDKRTLEHPKAVLPEGNFNLFLIPLKSKSGGSRSEVYAQINELISEHGDKARNYFNEDQNYTRKSTVALEELIEGFKPGNKKTVSKAKSQAIGDVVESVKNSKEVSEIREHLIGLSNGEKIDIIIELLVDMKGNSAKASTSTAAPADTKSEAKGESEEDRIQREQKEAEDEENRKKAEAKKKKEAELDKELRDLAGDFDDVKM